mmetsp:Transcript_41530/g.36885  ORF Transcript_41530/g.36885 Transcript_41530/m.36885 type:complete len:86 (-) Transcript_41530:1387-1644(-)
MDSYWTQLYMLAFFARILLYNGLIGGLEDYPLVQAISITTLSVLMLGYVLIVRPFKTELNFYEIVTYELLVLVVNVCVLVLAIYD